jgi:hypothetical protein
LSRLVHCLVMRLLRGSEMSDQTFKNDMDALDHAHDAVLEVTARIPNELDGMDDLVRRGDVIDAITSLYQKAQ